MTGAGLDEAAFPGRAVAEAEWDESEWVLAVGTFPPPLVEGFRFAAGARCGAGARFGFPEADFLAAVAFLLVRAGGFLDPFLLIDWRPWKAD
jgi:hypothetical protein